MEHMNVGLRRHTFKLPRAIGRRRVASAADRARTIMDELTEQHRTLHGCIGGVDGSLEHIAESNRVLQSAIFGFDDDTA